LPQRRSQTPFRPAALHATRPSPVSRRLPAGAAAHRQPPVAPARSAAGAFPWPAGTRTDRARAGPTHSPLPGPRSLRPGRGREAARVASAGGCRRPQRRRTSCSSRRRAAPLADCTTGPEHARTRRQFRCGTGHGRLVRDDRRPTAGQTEGSDRPAARSAFRRCPLQPVPAQGLSAGTKRRCHQGRHQSLAADPRSARYRDRARRSRSPARAPRRGARPPLQRPRSAALCAGQALYPRCLLSVRGAQDAARPYRRDERPCF
jgi:hypothetical protein